MPDCSPQLSIQSNAAAYFGIDVSENNGTINWANVAGNVDFAIIRCGYGMDQSDQDDSLWYTNANACTQYGIPFGTYIYSYANTTARASSEADHVLRLIDGYDLSLPVFYDLEESSVASGCTKYEILQIAKTFCDKITAAGYKVGIYANLNWWESYLTYSDYDQWYKWVAQYSSSCDYAGDYGMWQYSDSGSVSGVSGNVDVNYWYDYDPSSGSAGSNTGSNTGNNTGGSTSNSSGKYFGIDVSENNGTINWANVAGNVDFAIIRCGYGMDQSDQDDSQWYINANACTQYGIPFGTYIYSYANTTARASSEADHVLRLIDGYDLSLPVFYDLEESSVASGCTNSEIYQIAKTFCDKITAAGY